MIHIEKDVPPPERKTGRPPKYPFMKMEVGDSFTLPLAGTLTNKGSDTVTQRLRSATENHTKKYGRKFMLRTLKDEGVVRCWRIE